jgi:hypothetical protein
MVSPVWTAPGVALGVDDVVAAVVGTGVGITSWQTIANPIAFDIGRNDTSSSPVLKHKERPSKLAASERDPVNRKPKADAAVSHSRALSMNT